MINDKYFKKFTIDSKRIPIFWEKQRVSINEQLSKEFEPRRRRRFVLIHRWVDIAALIVICVIGGWFLMDHSVSPPYEVAVSEDEFFEVLDVGEKEPLPESLMVLNDYELTDYNDLIDYVAP